MAFFAFDFYWDFLLPNIFTLISPLIFKSNKKCVFNNIFLNIELLVLHCNICNTWRVPAWKLTIYILHFVVKNPVEYLKVLSSLYHLFSDKIIFQYTYILHRHIRHAMANPDWPKNMLWIKNPQFLPNHYKTWSKWSTHESHSNNELMPLYSIATDVRHRLTMR